MKIYVQKMNFKNMTLKKYVAPLITGKIQTIGKKMAYCIKTSLNV